MVPPLLKSPKVIFALLVAAVTAVGTFLAVERSGDPQSVLTEVDRQLAELPATIRRNTYELRGTNSQKPNDKSRALYRLSGPNGEIIFVEGPSDPNTSEVERIVAELSQKNQKTYVSWDSAWVAVQPLWSSLTYSNTQIAEAKALLHFDVKPAAASSYDWDYRFRTSKQPWHRQEVVEYQSQRSLYAAGAGVGAFLLVLLLLGAGGWLWRALLARIRELANAFRGK